MADPEIVREADRIEKLILGYTTRTTCRVCGSSDLTPLFSLGTLYVSNFVEPDADLGKYPRCPIDLELCNHCTLVQLRHTAPQELLYSRHYWYKSGTTQTMRWQLEDLAQRIDDLVNLSIGDLILDIGSNDGTFLRNFSKSIVTVGVEPASNLVEEGRKGIGCLINDFWPTGKYLDQFPKATVITALGMFYDLEDPNAFIAGVASALDYNGLFIAQLMCLKNMIDVGDVGNLCHEHLEYYSWRSLEYLLGKHGLEIFDVETVPVNGQSYRLYIRHSGSNCPSFKGAADRVRKAKTSELEMRLDQPSFYEGMFARMESNKKQVVSFIEDELYKGKQTWVYGASTKGNTLLQYYGLSFPTITCAVDKMQEKWGKVTIGSNILIQYAGYFPVERPDYYLVLPYAFIDEFVAKEADQPWRKRGGRFIVPLPEMRLV